LNHFIALICFFRNPAGLAIMCTYKYGSISMGLESYRYGTLSEWSSNPYSAHVAEPCESYSPFSACNVKWLGMRGDDLQLIPESAFQVLKPRDLQIAKSLLSSKFLQVCIWLLNFPVMLLCRKLRDDAAWAVRWAQRRSEE
jgi:hypothetical protein